jgi:hypothetical protein
MRQITAIDVHKIAGRAQLFPGGELQIVIANLSFCIRHGEHGDLAYYIGEEMDMRTMHGRVTWDSRSSEMPEIERKAFVRSMNFVLGDGAAPEAAWILCPHCGVQRALDVDTLGLPVMSLSDIWSR